LLLIYLLGPFLVSSPLTHTTHIQLQPSELSGDGSLVGYWWWSNRVLYLIWSAVEILVWSGQSEKCVDDRF